MSALSPKLYDLLSALPSLAGWTLIHAGQNGIKPPRPFGSIDVATNNRSPFQEGTLNLVDGLPAPFSGVRTLTGRESFQLRLSLYGDEAEDVGDRLAFEIQETDAGQMLCRALGLGFEPQAQSVNVPELREDLSFEPRVLFTIEGNHVLAYDESLAIIETVNAEVNGLQTSIQEP